MTLKEITIAELRSQLADIVSSIRFGNDTVVITKNKKRAAIIVSPEEYERLLDPTKRLTQKEWQKAVSELDKTAQKFRDNMPNMSDAKLQSLINEEVTAVRAQHLKKATLTKNSINSSPATP